MLHTATFIIDVNDGKNSYILWNGTESYYKILRSAYTDIINDKTSDYLHFGFFTLCACTLEYSLNYLLADFCVDKFGPENYKKYAEAYIGLPFPKKLFMTPNIISEGEFVFKETHSSYNNLTELITLRNKILHNKDFLKSWEFPVDINSPKTPETIEFSFQKEENYIETLTKEKCLQFGNALGVEIPFQMTPTLQSTLTHPPQFPMTHLGQSKLTPKRY